MLTVEGDIAEPATADRIIDEALERFGRIDTLVNNAGVFISKPFTDYTAEDYALGGRRQPHRVLRLTQRAIAEMLKRGRRPRRQHHDHPRRVRELQRARRCWPR